MIRNNPSVSYFRNFIFGVEDSLVSTVGLLSGIAVASVPRETIFLTGVILIFAEAFSMAAGSFLSEYSADEYAKGSNSPSRSNFISGVVMFFSYFLSGFIPLSPYLFLPVSEALKISVVLSIVALFILGIMSAEISKSSFIRSGFRMVVVGGIAIATGSIIGVLLTRFGF